MKVYSTLTGASEVKVHPSRDAAIDFVVAFINSCDDGLGATKENWEQSLAALNKEMDDAGEATYLAAIAEHVLPTPKLVIESGLGGIHAIHTDSPLLDGLEIASIDSGYDDGFEEGTEEAEVLQIAVGGGKPGDYLGTFVTAEKAKWDVGSAYEAIEAKQAANTFRP